MVTRLPAWSIAIAAIGVMFGSVWAAQKSVTYKTRPAQPVAVATPNTANTTPALKAPLPATDNRFWLGVTIAPAGTALRNQLHLGDEGLVVKDVMAGTPAYDAGILRDDVLLELAAGAMTTPLRDRNDLVRSVNLAAENHDTATVSFLRSGEKQSIAFTPALRPVPIYGSPSPRVVSEPDDLLLFEPVLAVPVVARSSVLTASPLPDNMTISITRTGNQPPQIDVRRGVDRWTITPQELNTLPADVRPYVAREIRYPLDGSTRLAAPDLLPAIR